MLRWFAKFLPYFLVEKIVLTSCGDRVQMNGEACQAWRIRDGVFLVKSDHHLLVEKKWALQEELRKVEKKLNPNPPKEEDD